MYSLGIYTTEMKSYVHIRTCTWIFIAVLFVIAKPGNNFNGRMVIKILYTYHGILHSNINTKVMFITRVMAASWRHSFFLSPPFNNQFGILCGSCEIQHHVSGELGGVLPTCASGNRQDRPQNGLQNQQELFKMATVSLSHGQGKLS